jgi:pimeloyl-ACP methyl ester carboxylesterase
MNRSVLVILCVACLWVPQYATASPPYFYPFVNPYEATVFELPQALEASLPNEIPTKEFAVTVFPDRKIPEVFWYENGLVCALSAQPRKAPLVFAIAGMGSRYDTARMLKFRKMLYQAGFHVVALSSPTHMDFVVNASTGLPGNAAEDARDLYRVMGQAYEQVRSTIEVTSFALAGYSLGAFHAAFVAKLDDEEHRFNFAKVLLVNPPVDLSVGASILDQLLADNIPGGMAHFGSWFRSIVTTYVGLTMDTGSKPLSGEVLYQAYKRHPLEEANLAAVIGLAFRMSAADMIFTTDVMNGDGYIVPKNARLTNSTSLTRFAMVAYRTSLLDYFSEVFLPYWQQREPGLTRQALIERGTLRAIEPYLAGSDKIRLIHNEDDIILAPGDIEYLQRLFGARMAVFPTGGHLGNMWHPAVVHAMAEFLTDKEPQ